MRTEDTDQTAQVARHNEEDQQSLLRQELGWSSHRKELRGANSFLHGYHPKSVDLKEAKTVSASDSVRLSL